MSAKMMEQGTRLAVRFNSEQIGNVTIEDLWNMSFPAIDSIAKSLNKETKLNEEESFITENHKDTVVELKLNIVKYIIKVRIKEREIYNNAAEQKAQKEKIMKAIARKKDEVMNSESIEDLEKMLNKL